VLLDYAIPTHFALNTSLIFRSGEEEIKISRVLSRPKLTNLLSTWLAYR